jgi:hypothetical protein
MPSRETLSPPPDANRSGIALAQSHQPEQPEPALMEAAA